MRKQADAEEAKRIAAEQDAKHVAAEEESRKVAAIEEEARRIAAEEEAQRNKGGASKKFKTPDSQRQPTVKLAVASGQVDFNAEANKAARILGC